MWHALGVAAAVAPALRIRLVVAHAETEPAAGFLGRDWGDAGGDSADAGCD